MKTENITVSKEDAMNISKWMTATSMMIEARLRTPYSQSELDTWEKFKVLYYSSDTSEQSRIKEVEE